MQIVDLVGGEFMLYIQKCSDKQIKELMKCYAEDYTDIEIIRREDGIDVQLINDGIPENYIVSDYDVKVCDWNDVEGDYLYNFRKKMLEYFGEKYAIDYLLNEV